MNNLSEGVPRNTLLDPVEYLIEETGFGTWRRFLDDKGNRFAEFKSHATLAGMPFVHYTSGKCPTTGKRVVAHGVIAIGRLAWGVIAIGQASFGLIAIGQLAIGVLFGLGQATSGVFAVGQLAIGVAFGLGQFATGSVAIGQIAFGRYVLAQLGFGDHVVDTRAVDPAAQQLFQPLLKLFGG